MVARTGLRFAVLTLASASAVSVFSIAGADTPPTRAVIRGTGKDVTIVYRIRPATPSAKAAATVPAADPLSEAIRMKTNGDSDAAVASYLAVHEAQIPDVVGADVLLQLRRAGAGAPVLALLSSYAAVDIGETGEGGAPPSGAPADVTAYGGLEPDLVSMGYPFYGGGYGGGYYGGGYAGNGAWGRWGMFGRRGLGPGFGHHPAFHRNSAFFRFGNSFFPRPHPLPVFPGRSGGHTVARVGRAR